MPIRMSGLASNMDTESIVKELMSAQRLKATKIENNITKLEWKQEKWKTLNSKIYSFYTGPLSKLKMQNSFKTVKTSSSNENKVTVASQGTAPEGTHKIVVKSVANTEMVTGDKLDTTISGSTTLTSLMKDAEGSSIDITVGDTKSTFNITSTTTVENFLKGLQDAGLNAVYDLSQKRFFISAKKSGYDNAFSITPSSSKVDLSKLGLSEIKAVTQDGKVNVTAGSKVSVVAPSDALITYNGAEIKSSSNTITVNGLTLTLKGVSNGVDTATESDDEVINIGVTKDTDAIYNMIKSFVKSYNDVIKDMNDQYYADTARGYEPLTDAQKESMTDDQITKWEDKIKNSLLRRDSVIDGIANKMKSAFSESVKYNGKKYSLSSFGITARYYSEKGILHIDGDTDDTLTAKYDDQLKKAINENPDAVMETFTKIAGEVYDDMSERMKSSTLRSAMTFYNDKEMNKTLTNYKSDLKDMEKRLDEMEDRYYKHFTSMETALSKLNSQSSSLTSLLGTSKS